MLGKILCQSLVSPTGLALPSLAHLRAFYGKDMALDHFGGLLLAWYSSDILTVLREPEEQANRRGYARADQCRRDSSLV